MAQSKDWIEIMNEYADSKKMDDRDLVEVFIMFVEANKQGGAFVQYLRQVTEKDDSPFKEIAPGVHVPKK